MSVFQDRNPATGECIAEIPVTSPEELQASVARARAATGTWASTPAEERFAALMRAAEGLSKHEDELADIATREMGKPRVDALREVKGYAASIAETLEEVRVAIEPESFGDDGTQLVRDPHGVVAAITPWRRGAGTLWSTVRAFPVRLLVMALPIVGSYQWMGSLPVKAFTLEEMAVAYLVPGGRGASSISRAQSELCRRFGNLKLVALPSCSASMRPSCVELASENIESSSSSPNGRPCFVV